ncbi:MAG TPA: gamma-glutamylcyclotransferase family protein [Candidatus Acidoferrum sp.]|nr:gamma-glutamylcyclotransferase family protein [Candidatus Acidoferrum sp.]
MRAKSKVTAGSARIPKKKARRPQTGSLPQYIFFYGSLKRGGEAHERLRGRVRFISPGRIRADLYRLSGQEYPGAVLTTSPNRFVKGDLFLLQDPEKTLRDLDEFEGVDEGLFRRELVDAWARGRRIKAWAYLYGRPLTDANLIPAGIYSSH